MDPGSALAGFGLAVDGEPQKIKTWAPRNPKDPAWHRLKEFGQWFDLLLFTWKPDIVAIELIALSRSHTVTRVLSRYEGVAGYIAARRGCIVVDHRVSEARSIVFPGQGNCSKEEAFKMLKKRYPDLPWLKYGKGGAGGGDQADGLTGALAAPSLVGR